MFNSVLHLLLIPSLFWFLICTILQRWHIVMLASIPVFAFIISYGNMFIPHTKVINKVSDFKVLTYNIHAEQNNLEAMVSVMGGAGADVVALQELSNAAADYFASVLSTIYPFQALRTIPSDPVNGQGVFSRFPIIADDYWRNDFLDECLAHQRVQIDLNGTVLTIYNVHFIDPIRKAGRLFYAGLRKQDVEAVLSRARHDPHPMILMGDFNMTDTSADYERIRTIFKDTYRQVGWGLGFTFPDFSMTKSLFGSKVLHIPLLVRLDYIFHSPDLTATESYVLPTSGGSDHRPVFGAFTFNTNATYPKSEAKPNGGDLLR